MDGSSINPAGVLVFKTNISTQHDKDNISPLLDADNSISDWHVDLDDCDKVLRVVTCRLCAMDVIELVNRKGYLCIELF
ncbi:hypothetical protein LJ707_19490 [Mucilaginibacter sp. UR6-1]|uniref:hypothetical protein n=1 Tax=Mucilaginibacter sp. UR6-1 TaxID=1435643 RepID=UPI001E31BE17|nr:hypothetical protein [Mucilaginibacter sp. UR6-1]MCC8411134.1 hypothetical protein [Mucilaginibacter sp. UR6-1]